MGLLLDISIDLLLEHIKILATLKCYSNKARERQHMGLRTKANWLVRDQAVKNQKRPSKLCLESLVLLLRLQNLFLRVWTPNVYPQGVSKGSKGSPCCHHLCWCQNHSLWTLNTSEKGVEGRELLIRLFFSISEQ